MIYFDNAATSYPKPFQVPQAMDNFLRSRSANPGRGGHRMALEAGRVVLGVREQVSGLIYAGEPEEIIFTSSATEALNLALIGGLRTGDHLVISSMEHNAVARTAYHLKGIGVEVGVVEADRWGMITPEDVARAIKRNTRMVAAVHASNVTGGIMPIEEIGSLCRKAGIRFLVDASQTAGVIPVNVQQAQADLLAFPGHKGLYGPPGIGVLYVGSGIELEPRKFGGTGSQSEDLEMPHLIPDRYEAGTLNTVGIAGLGAGIDFVQQTGMEKIAAHERELTRHLMVEIKDISRIKIYGPPNPEDRVGVVGFNIEGVDSTEVAFILDQVYGIAVRAGLHCAPLAHKTLGTLEKGLVRVSFSIFNTHKEVDQLISALHEIVREY
ncbi:MAG: aminotransferase class V-fold PLP-dependent enzyme [Syntrophomonadaceae bacterium]|nr:aminotransferase class V-fold PLP-dependent enzyme [Syntrophomonadaceae bacterium]